MRVLGLAPIIPHHAATDSTLANTFYPINYFSDYIPYGTSRASQPGFGYYPPDVDGHNFSIAEICYWFLRVSVIQISVSMSITRDAYDSTPLTFWAGSGTFDATVEMGVAFNSFGAPADEGQLYSGPPRFVVHSTLSLPMGGETGGDPLVLDFNFEFVADLITHYPLQDPKLDYCPFLDLNVGPAHCEFGEAVWGGTPDVASFIATDLALTKLYKDQYPKSTTTITYDRQFPIFRDTGYFGTDSSGDDIGFELTVSITISPQSFQSYPDDEGTPLYNISDGSFYNQSH